MRIGTKLFLSHGLLAMTMGLVCLLAIFALTLADRSQEQLRVTYDELRGLNEAHSQVNHLAEQIAELLAMTPAPANVAQKIAARDGLLESLVGLEDWARAELARPGLTAVRRAALEGRIAWLPEARATVMELSRVADDIVAALAAGDRGAAMALYASQVERNLDARITREITAAINREGARVAESIARSDDWHNLSWRIATGILLLGVVAAMASGVVLTRLVSRPVADLTREVDGLAREAGIDAPGARRGDELSALAARFGAMAVKIRQQRESLQTARDTLAGQVAERTASLEERSRELESANRRLTELDENRVQFFADISHELRTPLTVLRGQAEVALRNPQPRAEDLAGTLRALVRKAEQLGRLVDEMLFLARSEAGFMTVEKDLVVVQDLLAEALADAATLRDAGEVTIHAELPEAPVAVDADPLRLRQAMMILLDNAIRYAPAGTQVRATLLADAEGVTLCVADAGPGFTPAERAQAFERFFRGRRAGGPRGTGLGLSIARWIIDRHEGRIWISDHPGPGAEVCLWLRRAQPAKDSVKGAATGAAKDPAA